MKLKILVVPALIIASVIFVVWVILPQAKETYAKIKKGEEIRNRIAEIQDKNLRADKLANDLKINSEKKEVLTVFLPQEKKEESVIDNINYLTGREGLSISNLDVSQAPDSSGASLQKRANSSSKDDEDSFSLKPQKFKVSVGFVGSYEKIKSFLGKISGLKRYNGVESLEIEKVEDKAASESASAASTSDLAVRAVFDFSYLEKSAELAVNANDELFKSEKFNLAVIDQINEKANTDLVKLSLDKIAAGNPFLPSK